MTIIWLNSPWIFEDEEDDNDDDDDHDNDDDDDRIYEGKLAMPRNDEMKWNQTIK